MWRARGGALELNDQKPNSDSRAPPTSCHSEIFTIARFRVDLCNKAVVVEIRQSSCLLNFGTDTLLFEFNHRKKHQAKRKYENQTFFHFSQLR